MNSNEQRPSVWVGHILLETDQLEASAEFMKKIGMRFIVQQKPYVVMELRGGTHLVLMEKDEVMPQPAPFDLMVEDLEATYQQFSELGLQPSPIEQDTLHRSFIVKEPAGNSIKINSNHASGLPV